MSEQKYTCERCANLRTPLCELCNRIHSPSGRIRPPSLYVGADSVDSLKETLKDVQIALALASCGEDPTDKLVDIFKDCLGRRVVIPVVAIDAYNRIIASRYE